MTPTGCFDITTKNNTEHERHTAGQLRSLLERYDVGRWTYTRTIIIEQGAIPHSHPVLTLNTRHTDEHELLSTFLHEQIHWFLTGRERSAWNAQRELRVRYPDLPVGHPAGAADLDGSYLHLIVNYLELVALREVAGRDVAARVFHSWIDDHYTALYRIVLDDETSIAEIVARHELMA
jgi:hypothetical protein